MLCKYVYTYFTPEQLALANSVMTTTGNGSRGRFSKVSIT